jgi:hypothetical protein
LLLFLKSKNQRPVDNHLLESEKNRRPHSGQRARGLENLQKKGEKTRKIYELSTKVWITAKGNVWLRTKNRLIPATGNPPQIALWPLESKIDPPTAP